MTINVEALREQARKDGRVAIYDIPAAKWKLVYGPDAREMLAVGSGSLTGPEDAPAAPAESNPEDTFRLMDPEALAKLANELGVRGAAKLSRAELISAIQAKQAEAAKG